MSDMVLGRRPKAGGSTDQYQTSTRPEQDQQTTDDQGSVTAVAEEQEPVCRLLFCSAVTEAAWRSRPSTNNY